MVSFRLKKEYLSFTAVILCIYLIFRFPGQVKSGVDDGLSICAGTIIPSLFPFMTLSSYIIKSDFSDRMRKSFSLCRLLFRQPQRALPCIIMSMVGGFPVGIKMVNDLYKDGQLTDEQAHRLCFFCMNPGPAFVITAVGMNMLNNRKAGVIIYASLCISSLICGLITGLAGEKCGKNQVVKQGVSSASSLSASVTDSVQGMFSICGWIVLFSAFTSCLSNIIPNRLYIFTAVLEVTKGCTLLSGLTPLYITAALISFGGFCVHCQVLSCLKNVGLSYFRFLISRILNAVLSGIICYILLLLFPVELDVFAGNDNIRDFSFSYSFSAFFVFIFMCIILMFDIDRNRKYDKI